MERDFIYTPLIILNFPMTDFKTAMHCAIKCDLQDIAIGHKNNITHRTCLGDVFQNKKWSVPFSCGN